MYERNFTDSVTFTLDFIDPELSTTNIVKLQQYEDEINKLSYGTYNETLKGLHNIEYHTFYENYIDFKDTMIHKESYIDLVLYENTTALIQADHTFRISANESEIEILDLQFSPPLCEECYYSTEISIEIDTG